MSGYTRALDTDKFMHDKPLDTKSADRHAAGSIFDYKQRASHAILTNASELSIAARSEFQAYLALNPIEDPSVKHGNSSNVAGHKLPELPHATDLGHSLGYRPGASAEDAEEEEEEARRQRQLEQRHAAQRAVGRRNQRRSMLVAEDQSVLASMLGDLRAASVHELEHMGGGGGSSGGGGTVRPVVLETTAKKNPALKKIMSRSRLLGDVHNSDDSDDDAVSYSTSVGSKASQSSAASLSTREPHLLHVTSPRAAMPPLHARPPEPYAKRSSDFPPGSALGSPRLGSSLPQVPSYLLFLGVDHASHPSSVAPGRSGPLSPQQPGSPLSAGQHTLHLPPISTLRRKVSGAGSTEGGETQSAPQTARAPAATPPSGSARSATAGAPDTDLHVELGLPALEKAHGGPVGPRRGRRGSVVMQLQEGSPPGGRSSNGPPQASTSEPASPFAGHAAKAGRRASVVMPGEASPGHAAKAGRRSSILMPAGATAGLNLAKSLNINLRQHLHLHPHPHPHPSPLSAASSQQLQQSQHSQQQQQYERAAAPPRGVAATALFGHLSERTSGGAPTSGVLKQPSANMQHSSSSEFHKPSVVFAEAIYGGSGRSPSGKSSFHSNNSSGSGKQEGSGKNPAGGGKGFLSKLTDWVVGRG